MFRIRSPLSSFLTPLARDLRTPVLKKAVHPRLFSATSWHGTTILCVRKNGLTVMAGDGQVSMGSSVVKGNARKVRKLGDNILVGFAGSTADAMTLLERLEKKLEEYPGQLTRACVELAKAWRTEKYLRNLEVKRFLFLLSKT